MCIAGREGFGGGFCIFGMNGDNGVSDGVVESVERREREHDGGERESLRPDQKIFRANGGERKYRVRLMVVKGVKLVMCIAHDQDMCHVLSGKFGAKAATQTFLL